MFWYYTKGERSFLAGTRGHSCDAVWCKQTLSLHRHLSKQPAGIGFDLKRNALLSRETQRCSVRRTQRTSGLNSAIIHNSKVHYHNAHNQWVTTHSFSHSVCCCIGCLACNADINAPITTDSMLVNSFSVQPEAAKSASAICIWGVKHV